MFADWHWSEFSRGGIAGLVVAVPSVLVLLALRRTKTPPPALWGVVLGGAVASLIELPGTEALRDPGLPLWGWSLLGIGLVAAAWLPGQPLQAVAAGIALQVVLGRTDAILTLGDTGAALSALVPVAALAVSSCDDRFPGFGPGMFTLSVVGLYLAVPDTEVAFLLLGVAVPLGILGAPLTRFRIGGVGSAAAVALLVWVAAVEGVGRPGSAVGAVACLGMLVAEPTARLLTPRRRSPAVGNRRSAAWLPAAHLGLVVLACRVASLPASATAALAVAVPVLAAGVLIALRQARAIPR